jgi:hypothetical protein
MGEGFPHASGGAHEGAGPLVKRACERERFPPQLHQKFERLIERLAFFIFAEGGDRTEGEGRRLPLASEVTGPYFKKGGLI